MTAHVDVERIHAKRDVLLDYRDRSFDERKDNFSQLFERLDTSIATNNLQLTGAVLESVLTLADSSPFKALRDVAATRESMNEKGARSGSSEVSLQYRLNAPVRCMFTFALTDRTSVSTPIKLPAWSRKKYPVSGRRCSIP